MIDLPLFYVSIALVSAFSLILTVLVVAHIRLYRKYLEEFKSKNKSKTDLEAEIKNQLEAEMRNYFQTAKQKYDQLFTNVQNSSNEIISQAQSFDNSQKQLLQGSIEKATNAYSQAFSEKLKASETNLMNVFQKASDEIQGSTAQMLGILKANQEKRIASLDGEFDKLIAAFSEKLDVLVRGELDNARKASQSYIEKKMKIAEDKINMVIKDIVGQVLDKNISLDEHRELIRKSLDEAKKDGLFD